MTQAMRLGEIMVGSERKLPPTVDAPGILVAWSLETEHRRRPVGFGFGKEETIARAELVDPILMEGDGHLMTVAPTGAGKGTGCIVPTLLRYPGPVIVIDPKGENAAITARRRREMGQEVAIIDPMGVTGAEAATLNPLDLIDIDGPRAIDAAMALVEALSPATLGRNSTDGDYWRERGMTMVLGIVLHVLADLPTADRHLGTVSRLVARAMGEIGAYARIAERGEHGADNDTVLYALEQSRNTEARRIGSMLRMGAVTTLGGILSFSQSIVSVVRAGAVEASLTRTSFDMNAVLRGDPLSIYLVLPPHMLVSHGRLLRLWVHVLMTLISSRHSRPPQSTLFILDEVAQLGPFDLLRSAVTLMRGYGLQTWTFWQDPSQLTNLYPNDWQTMVNNCRTVQCFGANTLLAARAMADIVGFATPEQLLELEADEMLLQLSGDIPVVARLPNYLTDPAFSGYFDPNPFHDRGRPVVGPGSIVTRTFQRNVHPGSVGLTADFGSVPANAADLLKRLKR